MIISDRAGHEYLAIASAYWRKRLQEMDENPIRALDRARGELRAELVLRIGAPHRPPKIPLRREGPSITIRGRRPLRVRIVLDSEGKEVQRVLPSNEGERM